MRGRRRILAALVVLACIGGLAACGSPSARVAIPGVPVVPIGWNSWNAFGCSVDQSRIEAAADAMVSSGMQTAGYRYVVVDDCWVAPTRDSAGRLRADATRFPEGIASLARYVHSRGLLFGLYTSATTRTCAQRSGAWPGATGSEGHEAVDAATFASWGVDLVKDDWCAGQMAAGRQRAYFAAFRDGILATGRPIVLSINPNSGVSGTPGADEDWAGVATTVRISHDVIPRWTTGGSVNTSQGVREGISAAERSVGREWSRSIRQDADMLVAGLGPLTAAEQRSQVVMLATLGLPLMAGNDLTAMNPGTRALLTDKTIVDIAVDRTGRPTEVGDVQGVRIWVRPTTTGRVVAAYNPTGRAVTVSIRSVVGTHAVDLLSGERVDSSALRVSAHDTVLLRG